MSATQPSDIIYGRNGVAITKRTGRGGGYRNYEVHQRERVGESTEQIKPLQLISPEHLHDPYPLLEILREHYPFYRDWLANAYWVTRYNDVTSLFADDPNYETRSKRWYYGIENFGRDLREELPVLFAQADGMDTHAEPLAVELASQFAGRDGTDLATEFAARFPLELLTRVLDIPRDDRARFVERYWRMQRGMFWDPLAQQAGRDAITELTAYFEPLLETRRSAPGNDLVSTIANLELDDGPTTGADVVATLLEGDHETLHGGLANLWFLLLTHPEQLDLVRSERRLLKHAWFETLRHSTPVLSAQRFARHEVERFGKLIPEGALIVLSAAAANRDPRIFDAPDQFRVDRRDVCQREPRGMYRADGLAAGIAFGLGRPTRHPAVPEDRPRSLYALTRDAAVTASNVMLETFHEIRLSSKAEPTLQARRIWEMHTCWKLPATLTSS